MAKRELPSPNLLRKLLRYEPKTGKLFWRRRPVSMFPSTRSAKIWNTRFADKEAFTSIEGGGYRHGAILYQTYFAHRVILAMANNAWPDDETDHINGDRSDNRLTNLRAVSGYQNSKNRKRAANSTSGMMGLNWESRRKHWVARIYDAGRHRYLGSFDDFTEAVAARLAAEIKYGFHENHGRHYISPSAVPCASNSRRIQPQPKRAKMDSEE